MTDEHIVPVNIDVTEAKVTFTTKELLASIDHRIENIERIAEAAATRAEVNAAVARIDKLERDSEGTKAVASALLNSDQDRFTRNEKVVGLLFALIALMPSLLSIINLFQ